MSVRSSWSPRTENMLRARQSPSGLDGRGGTKTPLWSHWQQTWWHWNLSRRPARPTPCLHLLCRRFLAASSCERCILSTIYDELVLGGMLQLPQQSWEGEITKERDTKHGRGRPRKQYLVRWKPSWVDGARLTAPELLQNWKEEKASKGKRWAKDIQRPTVAPFFPFFWPISCTSGFHEQDSFSRWCTLMTSLSYSSYIAMPYVIIRHFRYVPPPPSHSLCFRANLRPKVTQ